MESRKSELVVLALLLVSNVALLVILASLLEITESENTIPIVTLIGALTTTPIFVAAVPLLSKTVRGIPSDVKAAAADAKTAKENTNALRNGEMDEKIRRVVRAEMPALINAEVRQVLLEMNLSCPRDEPAGKGATS